MPDDVVDIAQLTEAQQEALHTYTAVTDQDPISAIPILRRAEWNVQIAVTRFFEGEPTTDPVAEAQARIPPISSRQTANLQYEALLAETRRPLPRPSSEDVVQGVDTSSSVIPQYQPGLLLSVLFTPIHILYRVFSTVFSPFAFLIPPFVSRLVNNLFTAPRANRRPLPPAETAHRFIREFSETYPSDTALPWQESGFNLALDQAKKNQKFLLVVLLSTSHDQTSSYVRETLQSSTLRAFLASHSTSVMLWGGNVQEPEAYQVSTNLNCTKFPFVALVCQTPTSPSSTSATGGNMTVVLRAVGPMAASELVAKLESAIASHQTALSAARAQQAEQQASRSIREEQDSAYERSLAQDRERTRRKREEEEAQRKAEEVSRQREQEIETLKRRKQQWKSWRAAQISPEPAAGGNVIRVSIRMTDGSRVIRKFRSDDAVEEVYAFVECHSLLKGDGAPDTLTEDAQSGTQAQQQPTDYDHVYAFQLVSPMPRTVYDLHSGGTVGQVIGKGANLIVEEFDNEDGGGKSSSKEPTNSTIQ